MHQRADTPDRMVPWQPGRLAGGAVFTIPTGVNQSAIMMFVKKALDTGEDPAPLELLEVTISITDDAIRHMMGVKR